MERVFCVQLLLIAGNETTTSLIRNMVLALLEHPDQLQKVRDDPSLIASTLEEILRYDGPVQLLYRFATCDTEIAGHSIPKGSLVVPLYGSANRDEGKFPDADRLDVTRNAQGHVGFGYGIHYCLGAPVARLEAKVALEQLLRLPRLAANGPFERSKSTFLRGLQSLPLRFEPEPVSAS